MSVVVIGLNHRTASLGLLERMAIDDASLPKALHDVVTRQDVSEAVVLSTCNRTEVYVVAERFHGAFADVRNFFGELAFLPPEGYADHLYVHYDDEAARHLFRVAAGLDSDVVGEVEVLGQVRTAWQRSQEEGTVGPQLNMLFRHALEAGKRVRSETGISRHIASVSTAAVAMAGERLGTLDGQRILVLGAGEMGAGMVRALVDAGAAEVMVANRTFAKAQELAANVGGRPLRLADVGSALASVDLLMTSTGASSMIIEHGDVAGVMAARDGRPLLIVDVALPRDVDPAVDSVDGVDLLDMDDLRAFADAGLRERRREVDSAGVLVDAEVERFVSVAQAREVAPLVASLHERAEAVRTAELRRFAGKLSSLDDRDRELVEALTKGVVAKLLHDPTLVLKGAAGSARGERLADALRDLFDL
ncbi:MAG: glutamyl-tRNA reductase [Actinobacteria bacterium]|nr:glutamyl-tRNA reductase [Actinomycetota bacterium]